jgi:hypothetical protein
MKKKPLETLPHFLERCFQTSIGYSQPKLFVSSSTYMSYHATRSFKLMGADRKPQSEKSHVLLTNFDKVKRLTQ